MKGDKKAPTWFKYPGNDFVCRGKGLQQFREVEHGGYNLFVCDQRHQSAIRAQIPDMWGTKSFSPTLSPRSCVQAVLGTHAQITGTRLQGGGVCVAATVLRAEINCNLPQFTFQSSSESCKPSTDSRVQILLSDRFCQCNCCLGRETDSWCFQGCHLPSILCFFFFYTHQLQQVSPLMRTSDSVLPPTSVTPLAFQVWIFSVTLLRIREIKAHRVYCLLSFLFF